MKHFFTAIAQLSLLLIFAACQNQKGDSDIGLVSPRVKETVPEPIAEAEPVFLNTPVFANVDIKSGDNYAKIKSGRFQMGSPVSESERREDEVLHTVVLASDFELQKTVVTQAQYFLVMKNNPGYASRSICPLDYLEVKGGIAICPNRPVTGVSWIDAQEFISKLNLMDSKFNYQLPTEAEWEYGARAGSKSAYWFGDDASELGKYSCFRTNTELPGDCAVGTKPPNSWGLYDMVGNTRQWVLDGYGAYSDAVQTDPVGSNKITKVLRGGASADQAYDLRSAARSGFYYENREGGTGFRVMRR